MTNEQRKAFENVKQRMKDAEPYRDVWCSEFIVIEAQAELLKACREALELIADGTHQPAINIANAVLKQLQAQGA